jgi:hypothetical protein
MPIYKTDKRKDGKQQYRVFVNYTDPEGNQKRKTNSLHQTTKDPTV